MSCFNCNCKCTAVSVVAAVILGVIAAFLQITGTITVTAAFLWVALGIAVVYLGVLLVSTALARRTPTACGCSALNATLAGVLGSILFATVLLAVGVVATSVVSAILVGILVFFLTVAFAATACLVRTYADC